VARLAAGSGRETLEQLEAVYKKFHSGYPFEFTFLDDDYNALYASESRVSELSAYFAVLATLISCLGLFGLAVFSSERRTKEIGIRKVLGASTPGIVRLLASDIVRPVFVAILIAVPLSYLIGRNWLAEFAYRIELSWWFFVTAGVLALAVTWITVGVQTWRVARANPVESLKCE
jgi:ABC-type antimicrobial peptide transport system permease subunit